MLRKLSINIIIFFVVSFFCAKNAAAQSCVFDPSNPSALSANSIQIEKDEGIELAPCIQKLYPNYINQDISGLLNQAIRIAESYRAANSSTAKRFIGGAVKIPSGTFYINNPIEFNGNPDALASGYSPQITDPNAELLAVKILGTGVNSTKLVFTSSVNNSSAIRRSRSTKFGYITNLAKNGETTPTWREPLNRYSISDLTLKVAANASNVSGIDLSGMSFTNVENIEIIFEDAIGTCTNCIGFLFSGSPIIQIGPNKCKSENAIPNVDGGESPYYNAISSFKILGSPLSKSTLTGIKLTEELQWNSGQWLNGYEPSDSKYTRNNSFGYGLPLLATPRGPNANSFIGPAIIDGAKYGIMIEAGVGNTASNLIFKNISSAHIVLGGSSNQIPYSPSGDYMKGAECKLINNQCKCTLTNNTFAVMSASMNYLHDTTHYFSANQSERLVEYRNKIFSNVVKVKELNGRDSSAAVTADSFWVNSNLFKVAALCSRKNRLLFNSKDITGCYSASSDLSPPNTWIFNKSLTSSVSDTMRNHFGDIHNSICNNPSTSAALKSKLKCN